MLFLSSTKWFVKTFIHPIHELYLGESLFDLNDLRELCQRIQSTQNPLSEPVKPIHYVVLEYSPTLSLIQQVYKAGRFVGRGGQHLQLIERTLNVSLNVVNQKSNKHFRQIVNQLKEQNNETSKNGLWILINMKNNNDDIEKIKQSLQNEWNKIDVTTKKNRPMKKRFPRQVILSSTANISGDTRWKPKKQKSKDKHQKQSQEQEDIQPQPLVRPLSMPKEIPKSQKNKRK
jgi:hypothetical protein